MGGPARGPRPYVSAACASDARIDRSGRAADTRGSRNETESRRRQGKHRRGRPLLVRIARGLAAIGLAVVAAACGFVPGLDHAGQQDPTVVSGVVVDAAGVPLVNAEVTLSAADWASALAPGDEVRVVWIETTLTGPDGRFRFAGPPSPEIVKLAAVQGVVNFDITAVHPATRSVATWAFPRELDATQWLHDAPDVELTAVGAG